MTLEQAGKNMPFKEEEGYVEDLVRNITEQTICKADRKRAHSIPMRWLAGIAATLLLLVGVGLLWNINQADTPAIARAEQQEPLEVFLNSISDEEAQQIEFYEIEEIYF